MSHLRANFGKFVGTATLFAGVALAAGLGTAGVASAEPPPPPPNHCVPLPLKPCPPNQPPPPPGPPR